MKRFITLALLAALLCQLIGCSKSEEDTPTENVSSVDTTAPAEPELSAMERRQSIEDSLPADLQFDGKTVCILAREANPFDYEMGVTESNGEAVNDAIYERNNTVEERLGVDIVVDASAKDSASDTIRATVLTGEDTYTVCTGAMYAVAPLILQGNFINLYDVKYLDFDKPWWVHNLREELTIYDQLYYMSGDIALSLIQHEGAVFANKTLLDNYNIDEDLYNLVTEGKWTVDKLAELSGMVSVDLDGNGTMNEEDRFGVGVMDSTRILGLGFSCGLRITEMNDAGVPILALDKEHTYNVFDKVNSLLWDGKIAFTMFNGSCTGETKNSSEEIRVALLKSMFINDQVMFYLGGMLDTEEFRDMESDYDILPVPKYDEDQENYYSLSRDTFSVVVVPVTCGDTELAGAACEALSAESYRTVTPAYFDVALKGKYTRDARSAEMIDLVHSSISYNFGISYTLAMDFVSHIFQNAIENGESFASRYAAKKTVSENGLQDIIEYYEENR